jgi:hypothetical protein
MARRRQASYPEHIPKLQPVIASNTRPSSSSSLHLGTRSPVTVKQAQYAIKRKSILLFYSRHRLHRLPRTPHDIANNASSKPPPLQAAHILKPPLPKHPSLNTEPLITSPQTLSSITTSNPASPLFISFIQFLALAKFPDSRSSVVHPCSSCRNMYSRSTDLEVSGNFHIQSL